MSAYPGGNIGADSLQLDYDGSGNVIYIGLSHPKALTSDALWQIRKLTYDGSNNLLQWTWANGDRGFDKIWTNRVGYSYS